GAVIPRRRHRRLELSPARRLSTAAAPATSISTRRGHRGGRRHGLLRRDVEAHARAAIVVLDELAVRRPRDSRAPAESTTAERCPNERRHPLVLLVAGHRLQP